MLHTIRDAIRAITRSKGTAAVLLLSLAAGTGLNAAVYGVLDALLRRGPAGVGDPFRLVNIYTSEFSGPAYGPSSYPDYLSIQSSATTFAAIAAIDDTLVENVRLGEAAQSVRVAAVTDSFFAALQMRPHTGRLSRSDGGLWDPREAVVSLRFSEQHGGPEAVLGKTLGIGTSEYVIAGVAAPRFRGLELGRECDVWILMPPRPGRGDRRLSIVARLADDASVQNAEGDLRRIANELAERYPETNLGQTAQPETPRAITPLRYSRIDPGAGSRVALIGFVVGGASALLLASACLNAGTLLLSRALARRHESAIKMALGATRTTLVRELLTEAICLSIAGGALGLLLAVWALDAMPALFMAEQAELLDTRINSGMVLLTVGVACIAGAIFGVVPALHGTSSSAITALRGDAGGVSPQHGGARFRAALVCGQVALSTVLLVGTGLLVNGLQHALAGELGSAAARVGFVSIELPGRFADTVRGVQYRNRLLDEVPLLDGVEAAAWASTLPLGRGNRRPFRIEAGAPDVADTVELDTNVVSAGYFRVLSLPCIEGRLFDEADQALSAPVVVVDELLARRYFGARVLGRSLVDMGGGRAEIVGVVRTGRYRTLQQAPHPTAYYPSTQDYLWRGHLVVRTAHDPDVVLTRIEAALKQHTAGADVLGSSTLKRYLSEVLTFDRLATTLVGACGLVALAMSAIGVYGVMADTVERRTREIGLRVALGAGPARVARLVLVEAVYLSGAGLLTGAVVAFVASYVVQSFVHGVPWPDAPTLAAVVGTLAGVVAVGAILPLSRALRVAPNIALRSS